MKLKASTFFLSLILLMMCSNASPLCNSFPKVLGGGKVDSSIQQIDVFGDYLALVG
jgi:hypothetical protein